MRHSLYLRKTKQYYQKSRPRLKPIVFETQISPSPQNKNLRNQTVAATVEWTLCLHMLRWEIISQIPSKCQIENPSNLLLIISLVSSSGY